VKKRTQRKTAVMGKPAWTKRDKTSGEFMAVKKSGIRQQTHFVLHGFKAEGCDILDSAVTK
jgi:hypothetical protein